MLAIAHKMQSSPGRSGLSQPVFPTDYRDRKVVATLNYFTIVQSQCGPRCKIKFAVIVIKTNSAQKVGAIRAKIIY